MMAPGGDAVHAVIMAGGRGTRFWPVSRKGLPKQFIDLLGQGSLLSMTVGRILPLVPLERILVVTGEGFGDLVMEQVPGLPGENLLLEPEGRNTAACIGWAAREISRRSGPDALMSVLPSDHVIPDPGGFAESIEAALRPAGDGWLVTIGIRPDRPATGYGYLESGGDAGGFHRVLRFVEKPSLERAEAFVAGGRHFWNAGMFVWKAGRILEEIGLHMPGLAAGLAALEPGVRPSPGAYGALPSVSIDVGVMEKAERVAMIPASFRWDDVGDWPAARRVGASRGELLSVGGGDCTVWAPGRLVVVMGLSGLSVVESDGVLLVMADSSAQSLKEVVSRLERERPDLV
ncbi:MAG: mannose-1-phosphate guanylyltransferase [Candidatus Fermentibacter sp.]|nr:mannose-1-phosphate guanylyltransferase [Candidatus Fermentibacter sp.]